MKNIFVTLTVLGSILLTGCGTTQFSRGKFEDSRSVNLLNDRFGESHAQIISKDLIAQFLEQCPAVKDKSRIPYVGIKGIKNSTEEVIDLKMVTDQVKTALIRSGRFRFVSLDARTNLEEEYQYSEGGSVSVGTQKKRGNQIGADYILIGDLHGNVQQAGKDKTSYYFMNASLVNVETGAEECVASTENRSTYKKHREAE